MKCSVFVVAVALVMASCSQDETTGINKGSTIRFRTSVERTTRGVQTTLADLGEFKVTAVGNGANYFTDLGVSSSDNGATWTPAKIYYWPSYDLDFCAYAPQSLYQALGIFIPLIVVNCIILGRAEAFASKNGPVRSILDGLGMGLGFTLALTMLGVIREFLTSGSVFEVKVITAWSTDFLHPSAAPGAFIIVGGIIAAKNNCNRRKAIREGRLYVPPAGMDCHHCRICFTSKEGEE